jgi:hypothetical protein
MYTKPSLETLGTFRDLTRWGLSSASDGGSIFGVTVSSGCSTSWGGRTWEINCPPSGPTAS